MKRRPLLRIVNIMIHFSTLNCLLVELSIGEIVVNISQLVEEEIENSILSSENKVVFR